jgi:tetratricopeptide (TPR) repeat protein
LLGQRFLFETKMREVHAAFLEDWEPAYLLGRFVFADRGHKKEALQWFEAAWQRSAGNKRVLAARGEVLEAEGQLAEARVSFEAALPEITAQAGLARLDCISGEYLRAEERARAAGALRELGDALVGQSKWREAAEAYEEAAQKHPHALDALFQLAKTYRRLKQVEKADEALRRWKERSELLGLPVP